LLLTADQFPGELGESFEQACTAVGVAPAPGGYGLILAQDQQGGHWTQITDDVSGVDTAQSIWTTGIEYGYEPPDGSVVTVRPGWPVPCQPGVASHGEPRDPAGTGDSVVPPPRRGTPGRRRSMADIIEAELADLRGPSTAECAQAARQEEGDMGGAGPSPPPARMVDLRERIPRDHPAHRPVERALAGVWSLAATTRPPPGSVRVRTASPGKTRLIRANGDGWTLIGRTDGPVVVLTDAFPGLIADIDDESSLRELLAALTAAAQRAR